MHHAPHAPAGPTLPPGPITPSASVDGTRTWTRGRLAAALGGATAGTVGTLGLTNADQLPQYLPGVEQLGSHLTLTNALQYGVAPYVIGRTAANFVPESRPNLRAAVGFGAGGAALVAPSHFTIPILTAIGGWFAGKKAIQWAGLNREVYKSMDGPGKWNFVKREILSTPGKGLMGLLYSGWWPELHKDLRWQERIGAVIPQALRGTVRSFYTEWDKLQGFEMLPGLVIRPIVSAVSTIASALPGSGMFKSPDAFGKGVGNIITSPLKLPGAIKSFFSEPKS